MYKAPDMTAIVSSRRLMWLEHVARREEETMITRGLGREGQKEQDL